MFLKAWREDYEKREEKFYAALTKTTKATIDIPATLPTFPKFRKPIFACRYEKRCEERFDCGYELTKHLVRVHGRYIYANELEKYAQRYREGECKACREKVLLDSYAWYLHLRFRHHVPFYALVQSLNNGNGKVKVLLKEKPGEDNQQQQQQQQQQPPLKKRKM